MGSEGTDAKAMKDASGCAKDSRELRAQIVAQLIDGKTLAQTRASLSQSMGIRPRCSEFLRVTAQVERGLKEVLRPGRYVARRSQ